MSWPTYALDVLGTVSRGRSRHRPRDAAHLYGGPFPFIQTGDVKAAPMYLNSFTQTYSEAGLAQSKMWPKGTLCITIAANIAETCILDIDACFPDSIIGFVADSEMANTKFVKYQFDAMMREQMRRVSQGAAQDNLSQAKLLSFRFPVPDLPTQERIAGVLSAYDDLIENNRRRIALLEQAARLLYREWFVHFRFPGYETAKFIDGLPEGWQQGTLSDHVDLIKDAVKPNQMTREDIHIGLEHIPRRSFVLGDWEGTQGLASHKFRFLEGDIIFGKIRPYFHKVGFALRNGVASSDAFVWRVHEERMWPLVMCATSSDQFVALASQTVREGSKMPRADWTVLQQFQIPSPNEETLREFSRRVNPIAQACKKIAFQNRELAKARDLLLPRLMDGRLPIPE